MRGWFLLAAWLVVVLLASALPGDDGVADLRSAVNTRPPPYHPRSQPANAPPPKKRTEPKQAWQQDPSQPTPQDDDFSVGNGELVGTALLAGLVAASPVWIPASLVNDGEAQTGWFTRFPYEHHDFYMTFAQPPEGDTSPWTPHGYSLRLESDFGTNFGSQQLLGGHLLYEHVNRFGLESRFDLLEDSFAQHDSVWFGDVNGTYRFAQSEHWLFRGGLGLNWFADHGSTDVGLNGTYQIDWFPTDPLVFSTDIDVGTLGHAWLFHFQQTAGITWHGLEGRIGYDYLDVGHAQFSMLICGVRCWF
jgi:hypothetical protein